MRAYLLMAGLLLSACASDPAAPAAPVAAVSQRDPEEAKLPDYKPDTVKACNAVRLMVDLGGDGVVSVNGQPSTMDGLKAAAAKKDAACQNAPAMVLYSSTATAPADKRDAIKMLLQQTIVNLTLVETSKG